MSQRKSEYDRKAHDLYETPEWVTQEIITALKGSLPENAVIWEPCAGLGKMVRELEAANYTVFASDINEHENLNTVGSFLELSPPVGCDAIITNPPYDRGLVDKIVTRAVELMEPRKGIVVMLLKADWDSGKTRTHLFRDCPGWSRKHVLLERIEWFPRKVNPDGSLGPGPSENHKIYIWDHRAGRRPDTYQDLEEAA